MLKIVMINGAFGVGKTTVAEGLVARIADSMLYDPEEVGQMLRKVTQGYRLPAEDTGDFQDITLWPAMTVEVAKGLVAVYQRTLVVPMTLANEQYFSYVKEGLSELVGSLHHFCLTASVATIHRRLAQRGDTPGSWTFQQTARCVKEHRKPLYAEQIQDYVLRQISS